jgi:hypothetical protein
VNRLDSLLWKKQWPRVETICAFCLSMGSIGFKSSWLATFIAKTFVVRQSRTSDYTIDSRDDSVGFTERPIFRLDHEFGNAAGPQRRVCRFEAKRAL